MSKIADNIKEKILKLKKTSIKKDVEKRLNSFIAFGRKNTNIWFSELCFCILTANSKAETALKIQAGLGKNNAYGFLHFSESRVRDTIIKHRHRFHNNKSRYIVMARKFKNIKQVIGKMKKDGKSQSEIREFIVKNIKGLGYKEASHFLRNVGFFDLAILDRHILNLLKESGYIKDIPKPLTKKNYIEIEKTFKRIANNLKMSCAELDLYMWSIKTGKVLK